MKPAEVDVRPVPGSFVLAVRAIRETMVGLLMMFQCTTALGAADGSTLVNMGEIWSAMRIPFQVTQPAAGWTLRDFDDSRWSRVFPGADLEHQHPGLQELRPQAPPSRVFMRRVFHLSDPRGVKSLRLWVEHEQGFKAYLNGTLIASVVEQGMHINRVTSSSGVEEDVILDIAELDITSHRSLLVPGENLLALEGSQSFPGSRTISLSGLLTANISRGPFIQNTTTRSVQIVWRTDLPLTAEVEYGLTPALGWRAASGAVGTAHAVLLEGLTPDTTYYYRVRSGDGGDSVASSLAFFRTFKESGPIRFVFTADTGQNTPAQFLNARIMADQMPDLVLHGGDIIYGGFDDKTPDTRIFAQYHRHTGQMANTPFFFSIGNHDLNCCGGDTTEWNPNDFLLNARSFQNTFHLPTNSATGTEHFYSFDHGDAHFVALYNPWFTVYDFKRTTLQYQWLTNDLAVSRKPWKILFFHSPMAHSGQHAGADRNLNGIRDQVEVADLISEAANLYGVNLVLCGHEHNYERFVPTNGIHTVVSGGGGAGLYVFSSRHPRSSQFYSVNQCITVEVAGDTAVVQAVTTNGFVFDNWVIHQGLPAPSPHSSTWGSPLVEEVPADDFDGNLNNQSFDLSGRPILGRHGRFSNPGFFYVNNDATHLYLGFASLMIPDGADLFLFVEGGDASGVTDLKGVGNGVMDPQGQGADGLDCLENLGFEGFRPTVGLILGDEFGDGTNARLLRPRAGFVSGQGAFRLGAALSAVNGVRIQQYNRSPQTNSVDIRLNGVSMEQNADFVEVAIPLSELGGMGPGDAVKLGAVVGLNGFDATAMTRTLDTTVFGSGFRPDGAGGMILNPVEIRLVGPPTQDADADGLSDVWERANGLRTDSAQGIHGGEGDPDGDGADNLHELLAGTDPFDARSALKLTLTPAGEGRIRLSWPATPGRNYTLEASDRGLDLFGPYRRMNADSRLQLTPMSLLDPEPGAATLLQRSYRLRVE